MEYRNMDRSGCVQGTFWHHSQKKGRRLRKLPLLQLLGDEVQVIRHDQRDHPIVRLASACNIIADVDLRMRSNSDVVRSESSVKSQPAFFLNNFAGTV